MSDRFPTEISILEFPNPAQNILPTSSRDSVSSYTTILEEKP
ncbi:MAG: hypothetical protein QY308_07965 [Ignavibacteriaceae bacterium]|nr:MAG: hypothetical protein QY308_07965 [Ignavibacteriaceae bacterium]